jgi:hypothetical protein
LVWIYALHLEIKDAGQAGDLFGAINSLFTGLAFAGLIGTMIFQQRELKLQRRELSLQRKEVAETRGEISAQKEQMILQSEYMQKQMFEQTFFQMLRVFNEYLNAISSNKNGKISSGRNELAKICNRAGYLAKTEVDVAKRFNDIFEEGTDQIVGYMRVLFNILEYVENSKTNNPRYYTNIIRAQLSESELILIMMFSSPILQETFDTMIKKYDLLAFCPEKFSQRFDLQKIRAALADIG